MEINKENVLEAYKVARETGADSTCKVLEALFGKDTFVEKDNRPVTERIKTFEDACRELGIDAEEFEEAYVNAEPDVVAYFKLRIICKALNEGWEPQFTQDEWRYYPWFWLYTEDEIENMNEDEKQNRRLMSTGDYQTEFAGFGYAHSGLAPSFTNAAIGSRLCLKSESVAVYCGKQFIDLWADFYLIRK